jgi:hypothetical protein
VDENDHACRSDARDGYTDAHAGLSGAYTATTQARGAGGVQSTRRDATHSQQNGPPHTEKDESDFPDFFFSTLLLSSRLALAIAPEPQAGTSHRTR